MTRKRENRAIRFCRLAVQSVLFGSSFGMVCMTGVGVGLWDFSDPGDLIVAAIAGGLFGLIMSPFLIYAGWPDTAGASTVGGIVIVTAITTFVGGIAAALVDLVAFSVVISLACYALACLSFGNRAWRTHAQWQRMYANLCPHCRYDLSGNTTGICPECGQRRLYDL